MRRANAVSLASTIFLVVFATFTTFAQATEKGKMSADEIDVRAVVDRWAKAVKNRDAKELDAIFADDLFITDYNGGTRGKKEEIEVLKPSESVKTVSVENDNINVRIYGKTKVAVVTAVVKMIFESGGKQSPLAMRYTSVWEKRERGWKLAVLQTARISK